MDKLSNIAPKLSKIKKKQNFKVPKSYFEKFPVKLQERINKKRKIEPLKNIFPFLKPQLVYAIFIIGFGILVYSGYKLISTQKIQTHTQENILLSDIVKIIELNSSEFEENLFIENLDDTDIKDTTATEEENILIEYLIDENIDYEILIAQL